MDQRNAIILEVLPHGVEVGIVVPETDVLEHADRHDPVETIARRAIIFQAEFHARTQSPLVRAALRDLELLRRQRQPGDRGACDVCKIKRDPAPPAADVQNLGARLKQQLGSDVPFLGELRILQALSRILEIGAGILPVGIEKQLINAIVDIVMILDIGARPPPEFRQTPATD